MIRWTDLIGVAGSALVILSTFLLFPDSAERMNWKYWLGGIALWFVGFASVLVWLLLRWSIRYSKEGPLGCTPRRLSGLPHWHRVAPGSAAGIRSR